MDLEDRVMLVTPEGLTLELPLAGIGSRFAASLLDWLVRAALLLALLLVGAAFVDEEGGGWATALVIVAVFLVLFAYDILFELTFGGQTPGKRWTGLRVVDAAGGPVRFLPSAIRNLLRLVDFLPVFYLAGIVTLFVSTRNQRLGDMVAGTLVVRERRVVAPLAATPSPGVAASWSVTGADTTRGVGTAGAAAHPGWDVASVTAEEVATIRRFLERRTELLPEARSRLAQELAARLRPKVSMPEEGLGAEQFLERLVAVKASRGQ